MVDTGSKAFWDDLKWGRSHYAEFIRKYPDKWVAIFEKRVVAVGDSIKKVEKEAAEKTSQNPKRIAIMFIECGGHVY